ncbi:MAG: hypothetical protein NC417_05530 [Candidatus Gastranaerophilales bacterium]|nr:hypothetical protein [Candidatus Gastranaerophilales bacterium]
MGDYNIWVWFFDVVRDSGSMKYIIENFERQDNKLSRTTQDTKITTIAGAKLEHTEGVVVQ